MCRRRSRSAAARRAFTASAISSSSPRVTGGAAEFQRNYGVPLDPDYPNLLYGIDAKRSLIAKAVVSRDGIRTSFLPVLIDRQLWPEILQASALIVTS